MWRQALWFWPLLFVIPTGVVVLIRTNQSAAYQGGGLRLLALFLFSYAFYYFALSWPVWLTQFSWVKRLVVSALVPVGVLLVLAVLPLGRPMDMFAIQAPMPSFMLWFTPGELINDKLDSAVVASPCAIRMSEAREKGFYSYISRFAFLPDGKILILGGISKPGRPVSSPKLTRLLADGSLDPAFKGHDGCVRGGGLLLPQADGRFLLSGEMLDSTPYGPEKLARVLSPEGQEEREVSLPQLSKEQLVTGYVTELQLEPDGGFMAYGSFRGKNTKFQSFRLRLSSEGRPGLSSGVEVPGLESHRPEAFTRDAGGRFFITYDNPQYDGLGFFTLTADGRPDEAFQARLLETQREHGLYRGRALAVRPDGKIVAVFEKRAVTFEVVRLQPDGSLEPTFQRTPIPFEANHVSVLADGSIVVARVRENAGEGNLRGPVELLRLRPDGGVDEAVTQRMHEACASREVKELYGLGVKPDGTVLLNRRVPSASRDEKLRLLVQLRPDGSLDPDFQPPF
jgi:uncharacterized delta-60 repeat protein